MKGKQTNIGLGLWVIAVIISLEKQLSCWFWALRGMGERGCVQLATGKWVAQAEPGTCHDGSPGHPP